MYEQKERQCLDVDLAAKRAFKEEDKRIQDVVNDPGILEAINRKDYTSLFSNPKITALIQDPKLVKKMLGAYRQVMQEKMSSQNSNVK